MPEIGISKAELSLKKFHNSSGMPLSMNRDFQDIALFIAKRFGSAIVLLTGLATLIFILVHAAPGDPVNSFLSPTVPSTVANELRHQFGLDQPLFSQYTHWLGNVLTGNFGMSFSFRRPVGEVIATFFPNTGLLAVVAILLEIICGLLLGWICARFRGRSIDRIISNTNLMLYTLPTFWIGIVLLAVFSYWLNLVPSSQMTSIDSENLPFIQRILDFSKHLILPAVTVAIPGIAAVARYFRTSLLNVQEEEYITYARSFGISYRKIFFFYELPNALTPVITLIGLEFGTLLAGALVTETIFAWPGMGRLAVMAIIARDYPLIMGCTLISGVFVIVGNFFADLMYLLIDPRVRVSA